MEVHREGKKKTEEKKGRKEEPPLLWIARSTQYPRREQQEKKERKRKRRISRGREEARYKAQPEYCRAHHDDLDARPVDLGWRAQGGEGMRR